MTDPQRRAVVVRRRVLPGVSALVPRRNGDGVGDLDGVTARARLPRDARRRRDLAEPGDGVADGRPRLRRRRSRATSTRCSAGSAALDRLIEAAHARGIKVTMDLVPNHTSSQHPWFQAALAAGPGSDAARALHLPRRHRARRAASAQQLGVDLRRPGVDAGRRARRQPRPVVPAPVRRRAARPQLGQPARSSTTWRRRCGSGWTAASTGSASTSRTAWPSRPACRT